jgi:hypothetical protein
MSYGVEAIVMGQADGTICADVEAERLAFQVWGSTVGLLLLQANEREVEKRIPIRVDFDAVLGAHVDLVLRSLRGDAPVSSRRPSQRPGRAVLEEET